MLSLFTYTTFIYYHLLLPAAISLAIVWVINRTPTEIKLSAVIVLANLWSCLVSVALLYLSTSYALGQLLLLITHTPNLNTYLVLVNAIFP